MAARASRPHTPVGAPDSGQAPRRLRILVADDNPVNQMIAQRMLQLRGHEVHIVRTGREVLDRVVDRGEVFDIVLMDIRMPEIDGAEATRRIRASEAAGSGDRLPIVAVTAQAMPGDRERYLAVGMDAYISKPVRSAALYEVVERLAAGG